MHTIATTTPALALRITWELSQHGIDARIAEEDPTGMTTMSAAVVVPDDADLERIEAIVQDVLQAEQGVTARCPQCGYDLRGHTGRTRCPECASRVTASAVAAEGAEELVQQCACGETSPVHFELCWKCGHPLDPATTTRLRTASGRQADTKGPSLRSPAVHRLATIPDVTLAHRVLWKLRDAGIESMVTTEHPPFGVYLGMQQAIIWIADADDQDRVLAIYNEVLASRELNRIECPNCHYSMEGHGGSVRCPECALEFHAEPRPIKCAKCNEQSPGNFELCWSCGASLVQQ